MKTTTARAETISAVEGRTLLAEAARRWLNMSREEFIAAWDSGQFVDDERLGVQQVAMLLPFGRA
ncbi:hypothetical protein [Nocardioides speluncae]|uniref:hypothetical protein n=1 Tax=Nocardioides speluncae TaxID=2670337 RepID=UPI000D696231|nr:hypothetical protein [Nocardioides speluncae]